MIRAGEARDRLAAVETLDVSGYRVGLGVNKTVSNLSQDTTWMAKFDNCDAICEKKRE